MPEYTQNSWMRCLWDRDQRASGVVVKVTCKDGAPEVMGSHVLLAVGHIPNTSDLGLDRPEAATDVTNPPTDETNGPSKVTVPGPNGDNFNDAVSNLKFFR